MTDQKSLVLARREGMEDGYRRGYLDALDDVEDALKALGAPYIITRAAIRRVIEMLRRAR